MCFDYKEFVIFYNELKVYLASMYHVRSSLFEESFEKFLLDRFKLDAELLEIIVRNVNAFSSNQKLDCCINFIIKFIILSENAKCTNCTKQIDNLRSINQMNQLTKEANYELESRLQHDFNAIKQTEYESNNKLSGTSNSINFSLNKIIQISEQDYSSIISRCTYQNCLPCANMVYYFNHVNPCDKIQTNFHLIGDLRFQDLQFSGLFIEHLHHNLISKDFYELLDRLGWTFSIATVKMRNKFNSEILDRKLLYTRIPITLPDAIRLNVKSYENKIRPADQMDCDQIKTCLFVKFYYDPKYYISTNLFGHNLLNKLQITIDKRKMLFKFENNDRTFNLKEIKNSNFDNFSNLNFID